MCECVFVSKVSKALLRQMVDQRCFFSQPEPYTQHPTRVEYKEIANERCGNLVGKKKVKITVAQRQVQPEGII